MSTKSYTDQAIEDGHPEFITTGKTEKIRYIAVNHTERWRDPEEKVRAEYYAELIHRYRYEEASICNTTPYEGR